MKVTLSKDQKINRVEHKKGTTLNVSESIYDKLKAEGAIEVEKPKKIEKKED